MEGVNSLAVIMQLFEFENRDISKLTYHFMAFLYYQESNSRIRIHDISIE